MEKENTNIPPKRQKTIKSFFEGTPPSAHVSTEKEDKKIKSTKRALSIATADNWKNSSLIKYSGEVSLELNIDPANKTNVSTLACKICKRFKDQINSIKSFNEAWVQDESKRLLLHAAIEHAEGEPHKKAHDLHLKEQVLSIRQRSEVSNPNSGGVLRGLDVMKQKDFEKTKNKFETMYLVVKEELPITKFSKILELEGRHGVELGNAYLNSMSGSIMIDFIRKWLSNNLKKTEQPEFF